MCEFIFDDGRLVGCIDDGRWIVHGAGLSPEDLDKPQVWYPVHSAFANG